MGCRQRKNSFSMVGVDGSWHHDQASARLSRERGNDGFDIVGGFVKNYAGEFQSELAAELSIARPRVANPLKDGSEMTATRLSPGMISLSNSSHLPPISGSNVLKPVMLPPGRARLWT